MNLKKLKEYVEERCEWEGDCFVWQKAKPNGYGIFQLTKAIDPGRKMIQAHRAMYIACKGPIPKDKILMHTCDNPACCNFKHLVVGTVKDNVHDQIAKGRKCHSGMKAKLHHKEHRQIKRLHKVGITVQEIAKDFNVLPCTIYRIVRGEVKPHKPGEIARKAAYARWQKAGKYN